MDKSPLSYSRRAEEPEFNLREWALKANGISRQTTNSRRLSASNIRSFREDAAKSFRSTITTISSTASSPGYPLIRDEIDPSTYSFTTALKALQARSLGCGWECLSPEGFALNSKWNEAEKYICNPLSGEVPVQCLSAKTLSGRSFRKLTGRVTMSAPLAYSNRSPKVPTDPYYCATAFHEDDDGGEVPFPSTRAKMERMTRDVGTQSTPPDMSSSSSSSSGPAPPTPTIFEERSLKPCEAAGGSLPHSNAVSLNSDKQYNKWRLQLCKVKDNAREEEETKTQVENKAAEEKCKHKGRQFRGGCLSLWMRKRVKEKHKFRNKEAHHHLHAC